MQADQKKILIIEDDKPIAYALQLKLTHEGFLVGLAHDGEEGLKMLQDDTYDLILLDLVMPKIDGFKVLSLMKPKNKNAKVIVISNLNQFEDIRKVKELGAIEYLVKSNTALMEIVRVVRNVLEME